MKDHISIREPKVPTELAAIARAQTCAPLVLACVRALALSPVGDTGALCTVGQLCRLGPGCRSRGLKRTRINTFWAAEATGPMHEFFETKHIYGFGQAFIAVAAEQFQNPDRYCCEAFVAFPK